MRITLQCLSIVALFGAFATAAIIPDADCRVGELARDPEDCSKYKICVEGGNWESNVCPPGLEWNDKTKLCDFPENANCKVGLKARLVPAATCTLGELDKEPSDCTKYRICIGGGKWEVQDCPLDLEWNDKEKQCDYPELANCVPVSRKAAFASCKIGDLARDPEDCTKYKICIADGIWESNICPPGLEWNDKTKLCDFPEEANCKVDNTKARLAAAASCKIGDLARDPEDCTKYKICVDDGIWESNICPPGLEWNDNTKLCDFPENANCKVGDSKSRLAAAASCKIGDLARDPEDCTKYKICVDDGVWESNICPPGLEWNDKTKLCDFPEDANCKVDGSEARLAAADATCKLGELAKDPEDCSKYKICVAENGVWESNVCPPELEWNDRTKLCDYKDEVKCTVEKPNGVVASIDAAPKADYKVVCYFTNWAWYRTGVAQYVPEDIDPALCSHIIYGFATLDVNDLTIRPFDTWADIDNQFYRKVTSLKNRGAKVSIAIGGWTDSEGNKYSRLVNNPSARAKFINHVVGFISQHNFDGLDLDWEYPKCWQGDCGAGPASDKQAFADFVRELSAAFKPRGWLLSAAVSASASIIDEGYDVPAMSQYLDFINVMAYDYHGQWEKATAHHSNLYQHPNDADARLNAHATINHWINRGADRKKLILGMPMYGQTFTLANQNQNGMGAPTAGGGAAGEHTKAVGMLAYYEICTNIKYRGWQVTRDSEWRIGPYTSSGNQWAGFDDQGQITHKAEYIVKQNLGGAMIWALDLDDFRNICNCEPYPLLRAMNRVLRNYPGPQPHCQMP